MEILTGGIISNRKLEWFNHKSSESLGYKKEQTDTFAVLHPENEKDGVIYPLYVVFHSAGHSIYSCVSCIETEGNHDIYHPPKDMFGLFVDCFENKENDWWWGGINPLETTDETRYGTELQPVEKRILATVKYVSENFPIDKNRIYAAGNSMGGSGALGIALNHGNIFAAIIANVPAGIEHSIERCGFKNAKFAIPEPPVVVDYSAQNDIWSSGHEMLYYAMKEKKYALIGYWGPFGHENNYKRILEENDLVLCYNPLKLKLNEAYPAFTNTSSDDKIPWPDNLDSVKSGQINAFFVWSNITDTSDEFEMSIRLIRKQEWNTDKELPQNVKTFVTLRRLQNFSVSDGEEISYSYAAQKGIAKADEHGKITVALDIFQKDGFLKLKKKIAK